MRLSDGYATGYTAGRVRRIGKWIASRWPEMNAAGATCVVVSGNSGVSAGFAALAYADFPLVLVRKDNDSSHGSPIEGPGGFVMGNYVILDDLIGTGATLERIRNKIRTLHAAAQMPWQRGLQGLPECVGVCLYRYSAEWHSFEDKTTVPIWSDYV